MGIGEGEKGEKRYHGLAKEEKGNGGGLGIGLGSDCS